MRNRDNILTLCQMLLAAVAFAQTDSTVSQSRKWHYGFEIGHEIIPKVQDNNDRLVYSTPTVGWRTSLFINYDIHKYMDLSFGIAVDQGTHFMVSNTYYFMNDTFYNAEMFWKGKYMLYSVPVLIQYQIHNTAVVKCFAKSGVAFALKYLYYENIAFQLLDTNYIIRGENRYGAIPDFNTMTPQYRRSLYTLSAVMEIGMLFPLWHRRKIISSMYYMRGPVFIISKIEKGYYLSGNYIGLNLGIIL